MALPVLAIPQSGRLRAGMLKAQPILASMQHRPTSGIARAFLRAQTNASPRRKRLQNARFLLRSRRAAGSRFGRLKSGHPAISRRSEPCSSCGGAETWGWIFVREPEQRRQLGVIYVSGGGEARPPRTWTEVVSVFPNIAPTRATMSAMHPSFSPAIQLPPQGIMLQGSTATRESSLPLSSSPLGSKRLSKRDASKRLAALPRRSAEPSLDASHPQLN